MEVNERFVSLAEAISVLYDVNNGAVCLDNSSSQANSDSLPIFKDVVWNMSPDAKEPRQTLCLSNTHLTLQDSKTRHDIPLLELRGVKCNPLRNEIVLSSIASPNVRYYVPSFCQLLERLDDVCRKNAYMLEVWIDHGLPEAGEYHYPSMGIGMRRRSSLSHIVELYGRSAVPIDAAYQLTAWPSPKGGPNGRHILESTLITNEQKEYYCRTDCDTLCMYELTPLFKLHSQSAIGARITDWRSTTDGPASKPALLASELKPSVFRKIASAVLGEDSICTMCHNRTRRPSQCQSCKRPFCAQCCITAKSATDDSPTTSGAICIWCKWTQADDFNRLVPSVFTVHLPIKHLDITTESMRLKNLPIHIGNSNITNGKAWLDAFQKVSQIHVASSAMVSMSSSKCGEQEPYLMEGLVLMLKSEPEGSSTPASPNAESPDTDTTLRSLNLENWTQVMMRLTSNGKLYIFDVSTPVIKKVQLETHIDRLLEVSDEQIFQKDTKFALRLLPFRSRGDPGVCQEFTAPSAKLKRLWIRTLTDGARIRGQPRAVGALGRTSSDESPHPHRHAKASGEHSLQPTPSSTLRRHGATTPFDLGSPTASSTDFSNWTRSPSIYVERTVGHSHTEEKGIHPLISEHSKRVLKPLDLPEVITTPTDPDEETTASKDILGDQSKHSTKSGDGPKGYSTLPPQYARQALELLRRKARRAPPSTETLPPLDVEVELEDVPEVQEGTDTQEPAAAPDITTTPELHTKFGSLISTEVTEMHNTRPTTKRIMSVANRRYGTLAPARTRDRERDLSYASAFTQSEALDTPAKQPEMLTCSTTPKHNYQPPNSSPHRRIPGHLSVESLSNIPDMPHPSLHIDVNEGRTMEFSPPRIRRSGSIHQSQSPRFGTLTLNRISSTQDRKPLHSARRRLRHFGSPRLELCTHCWAHGCHICALKLRLGKSNTQTTESTSSPKFPRQESPNARSGLDSNLTPPPLSQEAVAIAFCEAQFPNVSDIESVKVAKQLFAFILSTLLDLYGGYQVKSSSRSCMVVFYSAQAALGWARACHRAMLWAPWHPLLLRHQDAVTVTESSFQNALRGLGTQASVSQTPKAKRPSVVNSRTTTKRTPKSARPPSRQTLPHETSGNNSTQRVLRYSLWLESLYQNANDTNPYETSAPSFAKNPTLRTRLLRWRRARCLLRGIRLRTGITMGDVEPKFNPTVGRFDFYGKCVNRCARIMATAQYGQILCDEGIADAVWGNNPDAELKPENLEVEPRPSSQGLLERVVEISKTKLYQLCQLVKNSDGSTMLHSFDRSTPPTSYFDDELISQLYLGETTQLSSQVMKALSLLVLWSALTTGFGLGTNPPHFNDLITAVAQIKRDAEETKDGSELAQLNLSETYLAHLSNVQARLETMGRHTLKGIEGHWTLYMPLDMDRSGLLKLFSSDGVTSDTQHAASNEMSTPSIVHETLLSPVAETVGQLK